MQTILTPFPVHSYPQSPQVVVLGQQSELDLSTIHDRAHYVFGEAWNGTLAVVLPARDEHDRGFQTITAAQWEATTKADGVWYTKTTPGNVLVMPSADCATVVGWQPNTKRLCLVHGGRPALTPHGTCQCQTILSRLVNVFGYRACQTVDDVLFTVTPCISAAQFPHDFHATARALIDPFRELHRMCPKYQTVSDDGRDALDLRAMIRLQLEQWYQVPRKNIRTHEACTYTHKALASRRGGDQSHNLTMVLF